MDPNPEPVTRSPRRMLAVVAAAAASVATVGGLAYGLTAGGTGPSLTAVTAPGSTGAVTDAAAGGSTTSPSNARHGLRALVRRAVHVEIVVAKPAGGFRTIDIDRGTVSAVSSTSITVTPPGGRAPVTAAITSTTRQPGGAVTQGEQVVLVSSDANALAVRPLSGARGGPASRSDGSPGPGSGTSGTSGVGATLS